MREIDSAEAAARFDELLDGLLSAGAIAIMRDGKVVAHLVPVLAPVEEEDQAKRTAAVERLREARRHWAPTGMTREEILAARHEGHRW